MELESEGLLDAHLNNHKIHKPKFYCAVCNIEFPKETILTRHMASDHGQNKNDQEWTCNDCQFQTNSTTDLMNHLKASGHQPSPSIQDARNKLFTCYTCNGEFSNYWNLMNHRKQNHPSNRICRNFIKDECTCGSDCWYVHVDPMDTSENVIVATPSTAPEFKCYLCDETFERITQ